MFEKEMGDMVIMLRQVRGDEKVALEKKIAETRRRRQPPEQMLADLIRQPKKLVDGHLVPV